MQWKVGVKCYIHSRGWRHLCQIQSFVSSLLFESFLESYFLINNNFKSATILRLGPLLRNLEFWSDLPKLILVIAKANKTLLTFVWVLWNLSVTDKYHTMKISATNQSNVMFSLASLLLSWISLSWRNSLGIEKGVPFPFWLTLP